MKYSFRGALGICWLGVIYLRLYPILWLHGSGGFTGRTDWHRALQGSPYVWTHTLL